MQGTHEHPWSIRLDTLAVRVFWICVTIEVLIVFCDWGFTLNRWIDDSSIRRIFNTAREESIPTWFASSQALLVGLVVLAIGYVAGLRGHSKMTRLGWYSVAAFFIFIAIDDAAEFHEGIGSALKRAAGDDADSGGAATVLGLENFGWQVYVLPFFALAGLLMFAFVFRHLHRHRLLRFFIAGLSLYVAAVGVDFLEGIRDSEGESGGLYEQLAETWEMRRYTVSHTAKMIEETLEMLGTTFFLYTFLRYLAVIADGLHVRIDGRGD
jgi:hypothetical protein